MKFVKYCLITLITSCATHPLRSQKALTYSPDLFVPISFLENKSHLALNVHYAPVQKIKEQLELTLPEPLKNRGEAHITVLSPPEYEKLKGSAGIDKINALALQNKIQQMAFKPLCLGRGRMQIDGREENTYFIVVESEDLLRLRVQIKELFVAAGGAPRDFDEKLFFPHITLGFTKRDLHYEDGILKDKTSCWQELRQE